jgi:hypothetical protein
MGPATDAGEGEPAERQAAAKSNVDRIFGKLFVSLTAEDAREPELPELVDRDTPALEDTAGQSPFVLATVGRVFTGGIVLTFAPSVAALPLTILISLPHTTSLNPLS